MRLEPQAQDSVLVVDDQPESLHMLMAMLRTKGYQVRPVPSGRLALQAAERAEPDLILLDILMPDLDGFAVCRELKASAALRHVPVIFLSASGSWEDKVAAFQCGGVDYIAKPFQAEEVEARVATHLRLARLRRDQEAVNRELDLFAQTAAHDLRSPLQHLAGLLDALARDLGPVGPPAAEHLEELFATTQRMDKLIEDLLAYASAAQVPLRLEPTGLDGLVQDCLDQLRDGLRGRRVRFERKPLPTVRGDPDLLRLVVQNLLQNAVKFTQGRAEAVIGIRPLEGEPGFLVEDNGVGFEPEAAGRLFTPFTRLHRPEEFPGTGLGLAHVQRIVARHGGRVWAQGAPGRGATFQVALPGPA